MTTFSAHVELRFETASLEAGGRRLQELTAATQACGFEMESLRMRNRDLEASLSHAAE